MEDSTISNDVPNGTESRHNKCAVVTTTSWGKKTIMFPSKSFPRENQNRSIKSSWLGHDAKLFRKNTNTRLPQRSPGEAAVGDNNNNDEHRRAIVPNTKRFLEPILWWMDSITPNLP